MFAVPGDLATPTGGYAYDRRIVAELAALGWQDRGARISARVFRAPRRTRAPRRCSGLRRWRPDVPIVIDGLAFGVMPEAAEALRASHTLVALVHHPLALESGLSAAEARVARERTCGAVRRSPCRVDQCGDRRGCLTPTTAFHPSG